MRAPIIRCTYRKWSTEHFGYGLKMLDPDPAVSKVSTLVAAIDRPADLAFSAEYSYQAHPSREIQAFCRRTTGLISCDTSRLVGRFVHDEPNPLVYTCKLQTQSDPWGVKMKPRIKVLTLGVDDLDRSLAFYRDGMGLETKGVIGQQFEDGAVVFFYMNDDLILALWPTASLSRDAKIAATQSRLGAVSIGHIVNSREEVDFIIRQAEQAGAVVTDPPHDRFWGGYSGYFRDPDDHLWEIAWNPQWSVPD